MAHRVFLGFLIVLSLSSLALSIYEDQVGLADWHKKYVGKVKQTVFHTQKSGRRRVVLSTEENVIASLDLRTGDIFWRHVLGKNDVVDQLSLSLGKYVLTLSSQGSVLRAWNLPDGQMIWETNLQISKSEQPLLHVLGNAKVGRDNLIIVCNGGWIHAISSMDGVIVWQKELSSNSLEIKHVFQPLESDTIYAIGFTSSSQIGSYHLNSKTGELLKHTTKSLIYKFSIGTIFAYAGTLVSLDSTESSLISIKINGENIGYYKTPVSDLVQDFSGTAQLLPVKSDGIFAIKTSSSVTFLRINGENKFEFVGKTDEKAVLSDSLSLSEQEQAFAIVNHEGTNIQLKVRVSTDSFKEVLSENIKVERERGRVERVFLNNYVRVDKSHGFRALIVMQDHSLLLVQQGDIVWSREDGLASIVGAVTAELPVEREGVSVAEVEHTLFEWLKGHVLKLKGTLMLANADEIVAIQAMRLKSSERNKMTRDHNGFRKLIITLTRPGKLLALHTGSGKIVWSAPLSPPPDQSDSCKSPSFLSLHPWRVPHHHAMDQNPSVLVTGRCGSGRDANGFMYMIDSHSGREIETLILGHSVAHVIPLGLTDSAERRLHLVVGTDLKVYLYPRSAETGELFSREMGNVYFYSVDKDKSIIKGYSLRAEDSLAYCFGMRELWSIVFPIESERIAATATREINEVVHTQAKVTGDQDVMYKYVSRNVLFVSTVSPEASGEIGSVLPEQASIAAYLIDTVTGRILHRVTHHGAQGPVHAVVSENWVVYHYFNLRAHRYEMSVIEIFDQSRADNKDVLKLVLGKHNLTAPITSYSRPEIVVKSQSYFFTHSVKAMAVTATAKGITSKQILIGTIGDQVLALDKRYLDPRRTANLSQTEREEGIIPLTDSLPIIPQSYVTHSLQVEGLRGIISFPSKLESTTHVFTYGVDLFYTRIAPSRTFDSLTDEFSYALLLITILALVVSIIATWVMSERKELREKWR